jgi:hypothetical protein
MLSALDTVHDLVCRDVIGRQFMISPLRIQCISAFLMQSVLMRDLPLHQDLRHVPVSRIDEVILDV